MKTRLLLVVLAVSMIVLSSCGAGRVIVQDPQTLVLTPEDLPSGTQYYVPEALPESGAYPNEELLTQLGSDTGTKLLSETGRVTGWRMIYQRYNADAPGIEAVACMVGLFKSAEGAQKFITDYNPVALKMQGYEMINPAPKVGDEAVALVLQQQNVGMEAHMTYRVQFTYRNASVTVQVADVAGNVTLDDAVGYANLLLGRLKQAKLGDVEQIGTVTASQ